MSTLRCPRISRNFRRPSATLKYVSVWYSGAVLTAPSRRATRAAATGEARRALTSRFLAIVRLAADTEDLVLQSPGGNLDRDCLSGLLAQQAFPNGWRYGDLVLFDIR